MLLVIADLPFRLDLDHRLLGRVRERYGPFLAGPETGAAPPVLRIEVAPGPGPADLHPEHVANPAVRAAGGIDRAWLSGDGFEMEFDWVRGTGRAVIPDSLAHVDLFLRVALGIALLREGATLLHAAGVVRDRFGIAFAGPSGAGKTTIAGLCRGIGLDVLADEMLVFRRSGLGHRFHGTPFWNGVPRSAPCGAVIFPVHAPEHRVRQIAPAEALPRLVAAGGAPMALADVQSAFFAACAEVLRRVPAYVLELTPDPGFWTVLDRLPEFAYFRPAQPAGPTRPKPIPLAGLLSRER